VSEATALEKAEIRRVSGGGERLARLTPHFVNSLDEQIQEKGVESGSQDCKGIGSQRDTEKGGATKADTPFSVLGGGKTIHWKN